MVPGRRRFFRVLTGEISADGGEFYLKDASLGYLAQNIQIDSDPHDL